MSTRKPEKKADVSGLCVWPVERKSWLSAGILTIVLAISVLIYYLLTPKTTGQVREVSKEQEKSLNTITKRIAEEKIMVWAKTPIIVNAVKEANKEATKSLDQIIELDKRWVATKETDEWVSSFLDNPCARYLKELQYKGKGQKILYAEIFVMDKQGCIVAETNKTSDYWQGDEDKFINSFADGKGAIFIDKPGYDESTQVLSLIQVSGPIFDPDTGKAIGTITVGLDLSLLAEQIGEL